MANHKTGADMILAIRSLYRATCRQLEHERLERGEMPNPSLTTPETARKYGWDIVGREVKRLEQFPRAVSCARAANLLESYHNNVSCGCVCGKANLDDCQSDKSTVLVDALADLMHWAKLHEIDFAHAMGTAQGHFDYEYNHPAEIQREDQEAGC